MTEPPPTEFEIRRSEIVGEIGDSLEKVLQQLNTLNRNLEGIITIGNEFSAVEALWSQFESVMGTTTTGTAEEHGDGSAGGGGAEKQPSVEREQGEARARERG